MEFKYYKLKLAEMERLMAAAAAAAAKEESKEKKTTEQRVSEALQSMLYIRKIASIKKRLFRRKKPGIGRQGARVSKVKRACIGTQTLLSAGTMLKQPQPCTSELARAAGSSLDTANPVSPDEVLSLEEGLGARDLRSLPEKALPLESQFPDGRCHATKRSLNCIAFLYVSEHSLIKRLYA